MGEPATQDTNSSSRAEDSVGGSDVMFMQPSSAPGEEEERFPGSSQSSDDHADSDADGSSQDGSSQEASDGASGDNPPMATGSGDDAGSGDDGSPSQEASGGDANPPAQDDSADGGGASEETASSDCDACDGNGVGDTIGGLGVLPQVGGLTETVRDVTGSVASVPADVIHNVSALPQSLIGQSGAGDIVSSLTSVPDDLLCMLGVENGVGGLIGDSGLGGLLGGNGLGLLDGNGVGGLAGSIVNSDIVTDTVTEPLSGLIHDVNAVVRDVNDTVDDLGSSLGLGDLAHDATSLIESTGLGNIGEGSSDLLTDVITAPRQLIDGENPANIVRDIISDTGQILDHTNLLDGVVGGDITSSVIDLDLASDGSSDGGQHLVNASAGPQTDDGLGANVLTSAENDSQHTADAQVIEVGPNGPSLLDANLLTSDQFEFPALDGAGQDSLVGTVQNLADVGDNGDGGVSIDILADVLFDGSIDGQDADGGVPLNQPPLSGNALGL